MDGRVPPCDPPAIYTQVLLQNIYLFNYNDMYNNVYILTHFGAFKIKSFGMRLIWKYEKKNKIKKTNQELINVVKNISFW